MLGPRYMQGEVALLMPQPGPSSASYVPEDMCAQRGGLGEGTNRHFGKQERATCLWERRLGVGVGNTDN